MQYDFPKGQPGVPPIEMADPPTDAPLGLSWFLDVSEREEPAPSVPKKRSQVANANLDERGLQVCVLFVVRNFYL